MADSVENACLSCDWRQAGDDLNQYLRKCPNCGAPFSNRYVQRIFVHPDGKRNAQSQSTEVSQ